MAVALIHTVILYTQKQKIEAVI